MSEEQKAVYENLKAGIPIDRFALDDECIEQVSRYSRAGEEHALAVSRRDEAKTAVDEIASLCADEARRELSRDGGRATDSSVKEYVTSHKDFLDATARYLDAKKEADLFASLRSDYDQRAKMLTELIKLYLANYFAKEAVKGSGRDLSEHTAEKAREALAARRKEWVK